jgi:hypothetical protein
VALSISLFNINIRSGLLWAKTDMNRAILAVVIKPVIGEILGNPISDFTHAFVLDDEVDGRSAPTANLLPSDIKLTCGVLVKGRGNTARDLPGQP